MAPVDPIRVERADDERLADYVGLRGPGSRAKEHSDVLIAETRRWWNVS